MATNSIFLEIGGLRLGERATVSIAIPALNEEQDIGPVIEGFVNSSYPAIVDILVLDGGSRDRTPEIVRDWSQRDPRVQLIGNPHRFQSHALNIALHYSKGDVFLRADAHCLYAPDYVERCVEELRRTGAFNVGGAQRFVACGPVQAGIALAVQSPCGSGGAKYRDTSYDGFAETVFLGCYLREVVVRVGGYAEQSIVNEDYELNWRLASGPFSIENRTNQDAELNLALGAREGQVVYVSSRIKVWYWPRQTFRRLALQYFNYGRGRALTSMRHNYLICRGAVPPMVLLSFGCIALVDLLIGTRGVLTLTLMAAIIAIVAFESVRIVATKRERFRSEIWRGPSDSAPGFLRLVAHVCAALVIMNLHHALGYWYQSIRMLRMGRVGW